MATDDNRPDEFEEFDIGDIDNQLNSESDLDKIEVEESQAPGDRKPISDFTKGVTNSISSLDFNTSAVGQEVERQFPVTSKFVDDATETVGQIQHMRTEIVKDMAPTLNQMKITGRRLLPRVKRILPESIYNKIHDKLSPEEKDRGLSEEELIKQGRDEKISGELNAIFTAQQAQADEDKANAEVDKYVQRSLDESRYKSTHDLLSSIKAYNYARTHFTQTSFKGYLMKSLELKYKHLFVAKDTLAITKVMAKLIDNKLEAIRHNTSLPDYAKLQTWEAFKEQQRALLIDKATESVGDFTANFRKNLMSNIQNKVKELTESTKSVLGDTTDMADMYLEGEEMADEMGIEDDADKSILQKAGGYLGSMALTQAAKQLVGKGTKILGQYGGDIEKTAEGFKRDAIFSVNDKMRNSENPVIQWFADNIMPSLDTERGESAALLKQNALEEVPFDVLTRRSIVEIIPGFLSKILQQTTNMALGTTDAPEQIFDIEKEDFTTTEDFRKKEDKRLFGTDKSRAKEVESSVSTLLGGFSAHGGEEEEFYENLPEIVKFINNIAKHGQNIKPDDIAKIAEGETTDTDYDTLAFKDIDDKTSIAQLLTKALYRSDGSKDIDVNQDLGALIKNLAIDRDKAFLEELHTFGGMGTRRQYSHLMDEDGNIDHDKVREIYADVDIGALTEEAPAKANRYKEELNKKQEARWLSSQENDDTEVSEASTEPQTIQERFSGVKKKVKDRVTKVYEEELLTDDKFAKLIKLIKDKKDTPENIQETLGDISEDAQSEVTGFINTVKAKEKKDEYLEKLKDPETRKEQKDKVNKQITETSTKIKDQITKGKEELSKHASSLSDKVRDKTGIDLERSLKDAHESISSKASEVKESIDPTLSGIKSSIGSINEPIRPVTDTQYQKIIDPTITGVQDTTQDTKQSIDPTLSSIKRSIDEQYQKAKDIATTKYDQAKEFADDQYQKNKDITLGTAGKRAKDIATTKYDQAKEFADDQYQQRIAPVIAPVDDATKDAHTSITMQTSPAKQSVAPTLGGIQKTIGGAGKRAKDLTITKYDQIKDLTLSDVQDSISNTGKLMRDTAKDAHKSISTKVSDTKESMDPKYVSIQESLDKISQEGIDAVASKYDQAKEFVDDQYQKNKDITLGTAGKRAKDLTITKYDQIKDLTLSDIKDSVSDTGEKVKDSLKDAHESISSKALKVKESIDPTLTNIQDSTSSINKQVKEKTDPGVDYVTDKYVQSKEYFDEQVKQGKAAFERSKDDTLKKASDIIKGTDSDPEVKDTSHISGPGVYVQGSEQEMHIPLDDESVYWKQIYDTLTEPMLNKFDDSTKSIIEAIETPEDDELLTTTKEIRDSVSEYLPLLSALGEGEDVTSLGEKKQGIFGKAKSAAGKGVGTMYDTGLGLVQSTYGAVGSVMEGGANMFKSSAGGIGSGLGSLMSGAGKVAGGAAGMYGGMLGGAGNRIKSWLSPGDTKTEPTFIAIYRKDEVDPGNPLLTARKQEQGIIFEDGQPVERSSDIVEPVFDAETNEPIITQDDLNHGLVNVRNEPIAEAGSGIVSKGKGILGKIAGGPMKLIKGMFPAAGKGLGMGMDMYKQIFDLGIGGIKGAGNMLGNLFTGGKKFADRDTIQELITDRLDAIYTLLDEYITDSEEPDKPRAGSYAARKAKASEEEDESSLDKLQRTNLSRKAGRAGLLGGLGSLGAAAINKLRGDDPEDSEESDDDGGVADTAKDVAVGGTLAEVIRRKGGALLTRGKDAVKNTVKGAAKGIKTAATTVAGGIKNTGSSVINAATKKTAQTAGKSAVKKTAVKTAGKALGKTALKSGLKKIPILGALAGLGFGAWRAAKGDWSGAALETGSGIAGALSFTGVGLAASLGMDAILLGKDIATMSPDDMDEDTKKLLSARLKAYGADTSDSQKILKLESWIAEILREGEKQNPETVKAWSEHFGFDASDDRQVSYFATWLKHRFSPIFVKYQTLLSHDYNVDMENQHELDSQEVNEILSKFDKMIKKDISKYKEFIPTMNGYRAKMKKQGVTIESSGPKLTKKATKDYKSKDYKSSSSSILGVMPKKKPPTNQKTIPTTPDDFMEGEVGAMSARYESGNRGSEAIGYDKVGGTSYGKYQIASATGTFDEFLKWLEGQPGGTEVATRLKEAGQANTGTTKGRVPNEWKKLAKEGLMGDLEHKFIKASHYDPALDKINNSDFVDKINSSKALQDVLWSTAVQHGASGAASIFNRAYHPKFTDEDIIRTIYKDRSTKFQSSSMNVRESVMNRFENEKENAIAMARMADTTKIDVATSTMTPASSSKSLQPTVTGYDDKSSQPSVVADVNRIQSPVSESDQIAATRAKSKSERSEVSITPDEKQHKLSEEQLATLTNISTGINNLSEQIYRSLGDGERFDEMNNNLRKQLDKESVINVNTNNSALAYQQDQQNNRSKQGVLDVSKHRYS